MFVSFMQNIVKHFLISSVLEYEDENINSTVLLRLIYTSTIQPIQYFFKYIQIIFLFGFTCPCKTSLKLIKKKSNYFYVIL